MPATSIPSASAHDSTAPSAGRRLLGASITLVLMFSVAITGVEMGAEGGAWPWIAAGSGLVLLVAAWRNSPILWNPLGQLLRSLLGVRGARVAFGCVAAVFVLMVGLGAAA
jgi:hypothetical protein